MRRRRSATKLSPGERRLLHDLAVVDRMMHADPTPAGERVDRILGADFTRAVRASLAGNTAKAA